MFERGLHPLKERPDFLVVFLEFDLLAQLIVS